MYICVYMYAYICVRVYIYMYTYIYSRFFTMRYADTLYYYRILFHFQDVGYNLL